MNRDERAAVGLIIAYMVGTMIVFKAVKNNVACFLLWVCWTLAVIAYIAIHDYREVQKERVHEQVKAVYKAEMNAINERDEYWTKRGENNESI